MNKLLLLFLSATALSLHKPAHTADGNGPHNPHNQITPSQAFTFFIMTGELAHTTDIPPVSPHSPKFIKYSPPAPKTKKQQKKTQKFGSNPSLTQPASKNSHRG